MFDSQEDEDLWDEIELFAQDAFTDLRVSKDLVGNSYTLNFKVSIKEQQVYNTHSLRELSGFLAGYYTCCVRDSEND